MCSPRRRWAQAQASKHITFSLDNPTLLSKQMVLSFNVTAYTWGQSPATAVPEPGAWLLAVGGHSTPTHSIHFGVSTAGVAPKPLE